MDIVLAKLKWNICLLYLDDICIFSSTTDEHFQRLEAVLACLSKAGLTLKPNKCKFFQNELNFLGHLVNAKGIYPNIEKIKTIKN